MDATPAYYIVPIIAIVGGITFVILNSYFRSRRGDDSAAALAEIRELLRTGQASAQTQARTIEDVERRLAGIE